MVGKETGDDSFPLNSDDDDDLDERKMKEIISILVK